MEVSQVHLAAMVDEYAANNKGPDVSIVDVVPSHYCALLQSKTTPSIRVTFM